MKELNRIEPKGRVGNVDNTRRVGNGLVTRFTLATNRSYKDANGEWQTETTWFSLESWDGFGRVPSERIDRGKMMHVIGHIRNDRYEDRDGVERQKMMVVVDECDLIDEPKDQQV